MAASKKQQQKLQKRIRAIKERKEQASKGLSEIIMQFCKPLIAESHQLNGDENAVGLGVFAWNAAFLSRKRWSANLEKSLNRFGLSEDAKATLEEIVAEMIRQKRLMYPDDRRVITGYDVHKEGAELDLTVNSKLAQKMPKPDSEEPGSLAKETFGPR